MRWEGKGMLRRSFIRSTPTCICCIVQVLRTQHLPIANSEKIAPKASIPRKTKSAKKNPTKSATELGRRQAFWESAGGGVSHTNAHDSPTPLPDFRIRGKNAQSKEKSCKTADEDHGPFDSSIIWSLFEIFFSKSFSQQNSNFFVDWGDDPKVR